MSDLPDGKKPLSKQEQIRREVLAKLAELGGEAFKDDDIERKGDKLILPAMMTEQQAIEFLNRKIKEQEEFTSFNRTFQYRPWDGAYCTYNAFKKAFGAVSHNTQTVQGFFGPQQVPPQLITLNTGPDTQEQIPWGEFGIPFLPGVLFTLGTDMDDELGPLFSIHVMAPRKYRAQIEGLFILIEDELKNHSMYRGKAIDGKDMPDFLDIKGVNPEHVVYSDEVMTQLEASVWSLIRHTEQHRELGISLKRAVLLEGPYGTGKTLAATLTAQEATENGWTFLYARPGKDDLARVFQTARLYQPSVVFFEDVDVLADSDGADADGVTRLLDMFDGIGAKTVDILGILTTNHADRIHKGMLRPGRLDALIHIGALDRQGVERLIKSVVPSSQLEETIDYDAVYQAMEGFMPAFVKEACTRAVRYALARDKGNTKFVLDSEDFINAASGLRPQLALMEEASDELTRDALGNATLRIVKDAAEEVIRTTIDPRLVQPEPRR